MPEFLNEEERKATNFKCFKIARIKDDKEQIDLEVEGIGTALDIVKAFHGEVGPFRIYNHFAMMCHADY